MVLEVVDRDRSRFRRIGKGGLSDYNIQNNKGDQYIEQLLEGGQEIDKDVPGQLGEESGKRVFYVV